MVGSTLNSTAQGVNVGQAVVTVQEFTYKRIALGSGTSKDVSGKRAILRAVVINTTLVAGVTINDGTSGVFVIPAGTLAGERLYYGDVGFKTNINLTVSASAGDLTLIFKAF